MPTSKKRGSKSSGTQAKKSTAAKKVAKKAAPKKTPQKKSSGVSTRILSGPKERVHTRLQAMEAGEKTTLDTLYIVNSSGNTVTLEVNAGAQGQTSDMSIKLDEPSLASKLPGDFPETAIGTNNTLHGKKLSLVATITDASRDTNLTTLTIRLKGGFKDQQFDLFKTVESEGGSADYLCLIEFFNPSM